MRDTTVALAVMHSRPETCTVAGPYHNLGRRTLSSDAGVRNITPDTCKVAAYTLDSFYFHTSHWGARAIPACRLLSPPRTSLIEALPPWLHVFTSCNGLAHVSIAPVLTVAAPRSLLVQCSRSTSRLIDSCTSSVTTSARAILRTWPTCGNHWRPALCSVGPPAAYGRLYSTAHTVPVLTEYRGAGTLATNVPSTAVFRCGRHREPTFTEVNRPSYYRAPSPEHCLLTEHRASGRTRLGGGRNG